MTVPDPLNVAGQVELSASEPFPSDPHAIALQQSLLWWRAEEENARRLASKATTLQALLSALLGAALLGSEELLGITGGIKNPIATGIVVSCMVLGLVGLVAALGVLLIRSDGKNERGQASYGLRWPPGAHFEPSKLDDWQARQLARQQIEESTGDLADRNATKETTLIQCQLVTYLSVVCLSLGAIVFMVTDHLQKTG